MEITYKTPSKEEREEAKTLREIRKETGDPCACCGKLHAHQSQLVVKLSIWEEIYNRLSNKTYSSVNTVICPDCMEYLWGKKFEISDLGRSRNFPYNLPFCNLYYMYTNGVFYTPTGIGELCLEYIKYLKWRRRENFSPYRITKFDQFLIKFNLYLG